MNRESQMALEGIWMKPRKISSPAAADPSRNFSDSGRQETADLIRASCKAFGIQLK